MEKLFTSEIQKLPDTYDWALHQPIDEIIYFLENVIKTSLVSVGSGRSLTIAQLVVKPHEHTGMISKLVYSMRNIFFKQEDIKANGVTLPKVNLSINRGKCYLRYTSSRGSFNPC